MSSELQSTIHNEMKLAMKAKDKPRLGTIRLIQSEFKRIEVDERIELDDARVLAVLDKMVKQRRDSAKQYEDAGRQELADQEHLEIKIITEFLPQPLTDDEIATLIDDAISQTGASNMQGMGQVMGILKPKLQGRADMGKVSGLIKAKLS
ncbi:MAG: GatB/YqeY domain-containing protein [Cellvibrionaceae bacterium]